MELIWGSHSVLQALKNPKRKNIKLLCTQSHFKKFEFIIRKSLVKYSIASNQEISKISGDNTHKGMILYTQQLSYCKSPICDHVLQENINNIIVMDHIQDVQNIGAIIRTMVALKFRSLLITKDGVPNLDKSIAKNACGAIEYLHVQKVTNLSMALKELKKHGYWITSLSGDFENSYIAQEKNVLVVGSEGFGIRPLVQQQCDMNLKIETSKEFNVLNASVAAAIGMYTINSLNR